MRKIVRVETRKSLPSTIMRNPSLNIQAKDFTHDCASILGSIAKGISLFYDFSHSESHPFTQ